MKGQIDVSTPEAYITALDEPRRSEIQRLDAVIRATVPHLTPFVHAGVLAYGPFHYRYASGREGDWFKIGVASNKRYISLYACAADEQGYVAERFRSRLPRASIGKSCVRFKRLADLDVEALKDLLRDAERAGFDV